MLDTLIYSGVVNLVSWLPEGLQHNVYHLLFTVDTIGSQEKGDCVFLLNYSHPVSDRILFATDRKFITTSIQEAIQISSEKSIPIQTIICHRAREYFVGKWVYPRPYELVYEYGEVSNKSESEYRAYFFDKLTTHPSVRLYDGDADQSRLLFVALLCSRYSFLMVYLFMRYQWYNKMCFQNLLIIAVILGLIG